MTHGTTFNIKYFASVREALGKDSEVLTTTAATVSALRTELIAKGEPYASTLSNTRLRMAVNHAMVSDDTTIEQGNEVAFFPPVTGG